MSSSKSITIPATQFKAQCLELMDRVNRTGLEITITKHGKPVARMIATEQQRVPLFGSLPVTIVGNIVDSTEENWEAEI